MVPTHLQRSRRGDAKRGLHGLRLVAAELREAEEERNTGHARADEQKSTHGAGSMTDPKSPQSYEFDILPTVQFAGLGVGAGYQEGEA